MNDQIKITERLAKVETRLDDMDTATKIAYGTMERRLEGMNEFREQLKDQTKPSSPEMNTTPFQKRLKIP